jgi:hypothetical protein
MSKERIEFRAIEAETPEVHAQFIEVRQFERQQVLVPAGHLRQPVVGQDVGPLLRLAEMRQFDHRDLRQPQLPRRHHPAVARDDPVRAIHQHRVVEAELPDRSRDLSHLRLGMRPRVVGERHEIGDRPMLDRPRAARAFCRCFPACHTPPRNKRRL